MAAPPAKRQRRLVVLSSDDEEGGLDSGRLGTVRVSFIFFLPIYLDFWELTGLVSYRTTDAIFSIQDETIRDILTKSQSAFFLAGEESEAETGS